MDQMPFKAGSGFQANIKLRNVDLVEARLIIRLRCQICGEEWTPKMSEGGRLLAYYWACPNKCNWRKPDEP